MNYRALLFMLTAGALLVGAGYFSGLISKKGAAPAWQLVADFEAESALQNWTLIDAQDETDPFVPYPQIADIYGEGGNQYLLRKPAADGIVCLLYTSDAADE